MSVKLDLISTCSWDGKTKVMSLEWNEAGIVISIPAFSMLRNQPNNRILNSYSCVWYAGMMPGME